MITKRITSVQNQNVKQWLEILNNKIVENQSAEMIVEGSNIIDESFKAGLLMTIISDSDNLEKLNYPNVNTFLVTSEILKKLSLTKSPTKLLGIINLKKYWAQQKFDEQSNILLLEDIQDPGNLGALLRSAYAFDFKNIIIVGETVSFLNPKVIRSTQGMFLKLHFQILKNNYINYLMQKLKNNYQFIGTSLKEPGSVLQTTIFPSYNKYLLMLGNEGHGLSHELEQLIQKNIKINIANDLDSLNVAQAGSIIMYEINKGDK